VRAKELKSFWRIVTPYFERYGIPVIVVNHTYQTMEMFSKTVVSGGQGNVLAANDIITIGRQQNKDKNTKVLHGYDFMLKVEKSRTVREQTIIPLTVRFDGGIQTHAGLLDIALAVGYAAKDGATKYVFIDPKTGEIDGLSFTRKAALEPKFWEKRQNDPLFNEAIRSHYRLDVKSLIAKAQEEIADDTP